MIEKQKAERLIDNYIKAFGRLSSAMSGGKDIEKAGKDLKDAREQLLAALTGSERPEGDLHKAIMNIQVDVKAKNASIQESVKAEKNIYIKLDMAYERGHRDARHAAAEIVAGRWRKVEP